ncbi:MAG: caspase family protein [Candidatus Brocadiae bacterium]|nr:caspase family protein [Candidatus Brocadiia bacterium]
MRHAAALLALVAALPAAAEPAAWEPETTWAVLVGILEWKDPALAPFPKENRQDRAFEAALKSAGVPAAQIVFLEDAAATLPAIRKALRETAEKAPEGSTLIFYFAGHGLQADGGAVAFANHECDTKRQAETAFAVTDLVRIVDRNFKGSRVLLTADCCYSGGLAKAVTELGKSRAAACLTSATACNVSTGRWTFTESLVALFSADGTLDADADGVVTFREADAHIAARMRFLEGQLTRGVVAGSFDREFRFLAIPPERAAKTVPGPWRIGSWCEVEWKKDWFRAEVLDGREGEWKVRYLGFGAEWDEWVPAKRIRRPTGIAVAAGAAVKVEWKGKWYPAKVMQVEDDFAFVHYDGYGNEWDEWVTAKRLKK